MLHISHENPCVYIPRFAYVVKLLQRDVLFRYVMHTTEYTVNTRLGRDAALAALPPITIKFIAYDCVSTPPLQLPDRLLKISLPYWIFFAYLAELIGCRVLYKKNNQ